MNKENYFIHGKIDNLKEAAPSNNNTILVSPVVGAKTPLGNNANQLKSSSEIELINEDSLQQKLRLKENKVDESNDIESQVKPEPDFSDIRESKNIGVNNFIEKEEVGTRRGSQNQFKKNDIKANITIEDYHSLTLSESIKYDKRTFMTYLFDNIIEEHRLLSLIFKRSLFDPVFIRINELIFELSLSFSMNALLFSDQYVDARASSPNKVSLNII
jgi:hypothetical protein